MGKRSSEEHIKSLLEKHGRLENKNPLSLHAIITGYNASGLGGKVARLIGKEHASPSYCDTYGEEDLDITKPHDIENVFARPAGPIFLRASILINCAATMDLKWFENYTAEEVKKIVDTNLIGAYNVTSAFIRATSETKCRKYIVHVGSMAARVPLNGSAPYCMSKAGLEMMCRCLAWELAPRNYNVLCVHPSNISDSPMEKKTIGAIQKFRGISYAAAVDYWNSGMIRQNMLDGDQIARLIYFFISGKCDYMSGSAVCLTGGNR